MATCDWCDFEVQAHEVVPVQLAPHAGIDGEPSDEELREDTFAGLRPARLIGECCPFCFMRGFHKHAPQFWMHEERVRAERAHRAINVR